MPTRLLVLSFVVGNLSTAQPADRAVVEQEIVEISKATTRLTGPLDDRGFVDYVAATNARHSHEVTPANNFEVVVRRIVGRGEIREHVEASYYDRLGIPIPDGPFLVDFRTHFRPDHEWLEKDDPVRIEFERILARPWTAKEFARGREWMLLVDEHLDTLVAGSRREHYYAPYVDPYREGAKLFEMMVPSAQGMRRLVRCLRIRANLHIGEGRLDAAWEDAMAINRIATHVATGATAIELLVGYHLRKHAVDTAAHLLSSPRLSDELLARMTRDVSALPKLPRWVDWLDTNGRTEVLEAVQSLAIAGREDVFDMWEMLDDLVVVPTDRSRVALRSAPMATSFILADDGEIPVGPVRRSAEKVIDWNVTMRSVNRWFDRRVAVLRDEDDLRRRVEITKLNNEFKELHWNARPRAGLRVRLILAQDTRRACGEFMAEQVLARMAPPMIGSTNQELRMRTRRDFLRLAIALERHRRDAGRLPKSLDALVPKYIERVPTDQFSNSKLYYLPRPNGFIVWSVGDNGENDGGRSTEDEDAPELVDWDDIAVRVHR